MTRAVLTLIGRETLLTWRQGGTGALAVLFFVLAVSLFPLGVGPGLALLREISAGVIWVAALLAAVLTLDRLFALDFEDGSLDLLMISPLPLELVATAKALAHWLNTAGPLILISPLLALLLNMDAGATTVLVTAMVLGTPALSFIGAIAAALTCSLKRGGVLIPLLVLPLYVPTLIFGAGAVTGAVTGEGNVTAALLFLASFSAFSIALAPFAAAAALKASME